MLQCSKLCCQSFSVVISKMINVSIGVVVGLRAEANLARRIARAVHVAGGSAEGARVGALSLAASGAEALVSFGLAGGLDPALPPGALVTPATVLWNGLRLACDPALAARLGATPAGTLLASATPVTAPAEKARLFAQTGAQAVDMESGAVAAVALAHGLPFAVLRAVCDPAGRAVPEAALAAVDETGAIRPGRLIALLIRRPAECMALIPLARDAARARRTLLDHLRALPAPDA